MIVAVLAVLAVHVTVDDVIDVTGMRNRDVLAADAVNVIVVMRVAGMAPRIARREIALAELVLVDVILMRVVQVTVVHVVDVIAVTHREMPAAVTVNVLVPVVDVRLHKHSSTYQSSTRRGSRQRAFGEQVAHVP